VNRQPVGESGWFSEMFSVGFWKSRLASEDDDGQERIQRMTLWRRQVL
jgi:hypothetical protein